MKDAEKMSSEDCLENTLFRLFPDMEFSPEEEGIVPLFREGLELAANGDLENALSQFDAVTQAMPQSIKAWRMVGKTALMLEKFSKADAAFRKALALDPLNIEVRYLIAHSYLLQDKVEEAASDLIDIIERVPEFLDAYYDCGVALQLLGRYGEAIDVFRRRLQFSPDFDTSIMCAMTYEMLMDYENTEKYYREALDMDPDNAMVLESCGAACLELERYDDALRYFQDALDLDPDSPDALYGRGRTFFSLDKIAEALADLTRAIKLDPENSLAWGMLGQLKLHLEEFECALHCLNKALELDPELLIYDFRASAKRGLGDLDGTLEDLDLALEYEPENVEFLLEKGVLLIEMQRYQDALPVFDTLVQMDSQPDHLSLRALVHMELLNYEQALDDLSAAMESGCRDIDVFLRRGEAFYQMGDTTSALADFRTALEIAEAQGDADYAQKCRTLLERLQD
ncbi:MAG: tetratricopeptide repeat protein [Planctomycetia bacterium]|nr:tetratricopeptide repeat protein [Planctomycetia bacterium]